MACQIFQWLIAGAGPTTLQHGLVGIGCLLAFDALSRWRKRRNPPVIRKLADEPSEDHIDQRRAA